MIKVESLASLALYQQDPAQHLALPNAASCGSSGYSLREGPSAAAFWSSIAANTSASVQQNLSISSTANNDGERTTNGTPTALSTTNCSTPPRSLLNMVQSLPALNDDIPKIQHQSSALYCRLLKQIPSYRNRASRLTSKLLMSSDPYSSIYSKRTSISKYQSAMRQDMRKRKSELNQATKDPGLIPCPPPPPINSFFMFHNEANETFKNPTSNYQTDPRINTTTTGHNIIACPDVKQLVTVTRNENPDNEENDFSILNIIPTLISEKHRKAAFVENLVDTAALVIEVIWSHFHINPAAKIIPLSIFLQETLRRSRTSYSTLQTGLFYLYRIKEKITSRACQIPTTNQNSTNYQYPLTPTSEIPSASQRRENNDPATCGRRMFLAALIVASKYLQDRNYSNKAWSKISGLPVHEINQNEIIFLKLIDYNLFISEDIFKRWSSLLLTHIQAISGSTMDNANAFKQAQNQREVERFRETLRHMDPKTMECRRNRASTFSGVFPITPGTSAPGSPREEMLPSNLDMDTESPVAQQMCIEPLHG